MPKKRAPAKPKRVLGTDTKDMVMVRSIIDPEARFFVASEMADDTAIETEIMGKMVQECVYEFPSKSDDGNSKPVRGLTITGVREAVRYINRNPKSGMKIGLDHSRMFTEEVERNGQRGILAKCLAVDHISGDSNWGIKFQAYNAHRRGGGTYVDTFVEEKASSKAQRNAKAGLIPVGLKLKIIERFAKQPGNVRQLAAPPKTQEVAKPMVPSTPEQLEVVIRRAIDKSTSGEELHGIADKVEKSAKLSKPKCAILAGLARQRANILLDNALGNTEKWGEENAG